MCGLTRIPTYSLLKHFSILFFWKPKWPLIMSAGLPRWLSGHRIHLQYRRCGFDPQVGKIPWGRNGNLFLPRESPWTEKSGGLQSMGLQESDMTEHMHTHTHTHTHSVCYHRFGLVASRWEVNSSKVIRNPHLAPPHPSSFSLASLWLKEAFRLMIGFIHLHSSCYG